MKVLQIIDNDKKQNHYPGHNIKQDDYTLCGLVASGDEKLGLSKPIEIDGKITCPDCVAIIRHCHKVWTTHIDWDALQKP